MRQCFITFPNPKKRAENMMQSEVFLTKFSMFGNNYDETLTSKPLSHSLLWFKFYHFENDLLAKILKLRSSNVLMRVVYLCEVHVVFEGCYCISFIIKLAVNFVSN